MEHVIIGYGYCGFYLARQLLQRGFRVTAYSRHYPECYYLKELKHCAKDISTADISSPHPLIVYYLIPPPQQGIRDETLSQFLAVNKQYINKIIYFGSSAVYGDHHGAWVQETTPCHLEYDRQRRRLDAEQQCQTIAGHNLLRIAGIYGPNRLPLAAAKNQSPIICTEEAPYVNYIYVEDLAQIAINIALSNVNATVNVADGEPIKAGQFQNLVAQSLGYPLAREEHKETILEHANPQKQEILSSSKRLSILRLQEILANNVMLTTKTIGIMQSIPTDY